MSGPQNEPLALLTVEIQKLGEQVRAQTEQISEQSRSIEALQKKLSEKDETIRDLLKELDELKKRGIGTSQYKGEPSTCQNTTNEAAQNKGYSGNIIIDFPVLSKSNLSKKRNTQMTTEDNVKKKSKIETLDEKVTMVDISSDEEMEIADASRSAADAANEKSNEISQNNDGQETQETDADKATSINTNAKPNWSDIVSNEQPILTLDQLANVKSTFNSNDLIKIKPKGSENKNSTKVYVSPIEIIVDNHEQRANIQHLLVHNVNLRCFTLTNAKQTVRINPTDNETKTRIVNVLKANSIKFVTFADDKNKNKPFIMRGLIEDAIGKDDLKNILCANGFDVLVCEPFKTGYHRTNEIKSHLWKVVFSDKTTDEEIHSIGYVLNTAVKFEKIKRRGAIQCRRCQGFMHTATHCNRDYKCVKCGKTHAIGECEVREEKQLKCANCNGNHSANNLNKCKYFQEKILPKTNKNKLRTTSKPNAERTEKNTGNKTPEKKSKNNENSNNQNNIYEELNRIEHRMTEKLNALFKQFNRGPATPKNKNNKKRSKR